MKNVILAALFALCSMSVSFAGQCSNGSCSVQPRKVVTVTKSVVRETVSVPRRVFNRCTGSSCYSRTVTRVK